MFVQYLKAEKKIITPKKKTISPRNVFLGCCVADVVDGKFKIGYSVINPHDIEAVKQENVLIRKEIAKIKEQQKAGKGPVENLPKLKREFDKKYARELAISRLQEKVDFNKVPKKIRRQLAFFIYKVAGSYYGRNHIL